VKNLTLQEAVVIVKSEGLHGYFANFFVDETVFAQVICAFRDNAANLHRECRKFKQDWRYRTGFL
jgi:hypothetical protein